MVKKADKDVNNGHLSITPPSYLGRQAKVTWRKIVPFLEDLSKVKRVDGQLVEMYCTQYEIYRNAYKHILENGEVQAIYKTLQDSSGQKIGKDFVGYKRNPMTQVYDTALKNLEKVGSELGLSPKSRAEMLALPENKEKAKSTADMVKEFINGGTSK